MARKTKKRKTLHDVFPDVKDLSWAKTIEAILPSFIAMPDPGIQVPVLVASLCCYSGSADRLPIIGCIGASRSGKSSLSKFIGRIYDSIQPIDLTLPALKKHLHNNQSLRDASGALLINQDGTVVNTHQVIRLEEVSKQKIAPSTALYGLIKNSRDPATSIYSQSSLNRDTENETIEYDVYCLMVITSIYPFFQNPEFSELDGRTVWLHFEQSEHADFMNPDDIDFSDLSRQFYREHQSLGIDEYFELLSSLRKPRSISTSAWDKFKNPLASGIALNFWTKDKGIECIKEYCSYRDLFFPVARTDPLIDFLNRWLDGRYTVQPVLVKTAVATAFRHGMIPLKRWDNEQLHDAMISLGYKLECDPNYSVNISAEPELVWVKQTRGKK
jgi:hypothetical protein